MNKIEFIHWKDADKSLWQYGTNHPIGQEWGASQSMFGRGTGYFITNGRGESMSIHGGTKFEEICNVIDALNKRDVEIAELKNSIKPKG